MDFTPREQPEDDLTSIYHRWIASFDVLRSEDIDSIRIHAESSRLVAPLVVLRFDEHCESRLQLALEGLEDQVLGDWQAIIYLDESCSTDTVVLAHDRTREDSRFSVLTSIDGYPLSYLCSAGAVVFAHGSVRLREHALYMFAHAASEREIAMVYADEDQLDANGERLSPIFKPEFSPELLRNHSYLGNCILLRGPPSLLRSTAVDFLTRSKDPSALALDLVHRVSREDFVHVPHILFHDTQARCSRMPKERPHSSDITLPSVSIIIPTKDRLELLRPCLKSIETQTKYPRDLYEIVVVDNGTSDPETLSYLSTCAESGVIRLLHDPFEFNFSRINNTAATQCRSDILVFLNNDTVVIDPQWIHRLTTYAVQSDVGAVGCKLLYPNGAVQHGGMVVGIRGSAVHSHVGISRNDLGFQRLADLTREVAAVTGACMAIRRKLFLEFHGFDEQLPIAFNDTDLCLRALSLGYRNIWIRDALAIHYECSSRGPNDTQARIAQFRREAAFTRERHSRLYKHDPYYNANLSVNRLYDFAVPPRRTKPWQIRCPEPTKLQILYLARTCLPHDPISAAVAAQVKLLISLGHKVTLSFPFENSAAVQADCTCVVNSEPEEAAVFAVQHGVDCIIVTDAPFFSVVPLIGDWPRTICCDYGELPEELFEDVRESLMEDKAISFSMTHGIMSVPDLQADDTRSPPVSRHFDELASLLRILWSTNLESCPLDMRQKKCSTGDKNDSSGGAFGGRLLDVSDRSSMKNRAKFYAKLRNLDGEALVDQLYLSVLGRYPDPHGRKVYVDQLSRGISKADIIWEIADSAEAKYRRVNPRDVMVAAGVSDATRTVADGSKADYGARLSAPICDVGALLKFEGEEFIREAYVTLLGRLPDTNGFSHYMEELRSGTSKIEIVSRLTSSAEGRRRGVRLKGYRGQVLKHRLGDFLRLSSQRRNGA